MSKVKLLDIEEIEHEVFTRWDITGHQVNPPAERQTGSGRDVLPYRGVW